MSRTASWHAPNGQVHNQIDFILTPQRFKSSIKEANTRSFPGADIGSDHDLVPTTIKLKLKTKRFTKSSRIRFNLEKLKDPKIAEVFQAKVGGMFAAPCVLDSDVDTLGNSLKRSATPNTSRLISIRISAKPHNTTVIQVHSPTSDHKQFYEQLDSIIAKTPKKDILVVQGD